jgi:hypothetical protein
MKYCDFEVGEKLVYLGSSYGWNFNNRDEGIQKFDMCTVRTIIPGTGTTFITLEGYHEMYLWDYFCRLNDKKLRKNKINKIMKKI